MSWRPVFISSTFQDMQAERDHLRNYVFPELEERLLAIHQHLEWVDLRIGVAVASQSDEGARELQVLKVCLDEVRRCRPYLIVLLGDRYGWIPPESHIRTAAAEAGFGADVAGRSVTDLEIDFGILSDPEQQYRSYIYFRDPLPYEQMSPADAARYSSAHEPGRSHSEADRRLAALKRRIEAALPKRVRRYSAGWDRERRTVIGLDAWGQQVLEDLWREVSRPAASTSDAPAVPSPHPERDALDEFVEDRTRDFVGRGEILKELATLALSDHSQPDAWGVCLTGEAGSGKSAVFARLYRELSARAFVLAHASGASPRSGSIDVMLRRWIDEMAATLGIAAGVFDDSHPEEIERAFASLLARIASRRRVVVLIDGLDQFETTSRGRFVTWLPRPWPENARLIATAIPGAGSAALAERGGIKTLPLPPFDSDETRGLIRAICDRYHRTLEPEVVDALMAKASNAGGGASSPLWLVVAVEDLNLIDGDDLARVERDYVGPPAERMRALMIALVAALPPDVPALYDETFGRVAKRFGAAADAFVGLIGVSRAGWREGDFRALMPQITSEPWDELRFAQLRRFCRGQMRQRREAGQWDFRHDQMRRATLARLASRPPGRAELHRLIADHLIALPPNDPLHVTETMVHLAGSEDWTRAARYYGSAELSDEEEQGATRALADSVLLAPRAAARDAIEQLLRLLDAAAADPPSAETAVRRLQDRLMNALERRVPLADLAPLIDRLKDAFDALQRANPNINRLNHDLSSAWIRVGESRRDLGDLAGAAAAFQSAMIAAERLLSRERNRGDWLRQVALVQGRLGDLLEQIGDLPAAEAAYRAAAAGAARLLTIGPDADVEHELAAYRSNLADVLKARGDITGAEHEQRAASTPAEALARAHPDNDVWQRASAAHTFKLGEFALARGDGASAEAARRSALARMQRLAERDPANRAWQDDLLSMYLRTPPHATDAPDAFTRAREIAERLVTADAGDTGARRNLALAHGNLSRVRLGEGDVVAAERSASAAVAAAQQLADQDRNNPGWLRDLAAAQGFLGDVQLARDDYRAAEASYRDVLSIMQALTAREPHNREWQRDLAISQERVAAALRGRGDLAGAESAQRASGAVVKDLAAAEVANPQWKRDLALSYSTLSDIQQARGDSAAAAQTTRAALEIMAEVIGREPGHAEWLSIACVLYDQLGDIQVSAGDLAGAAASLEAALAIKRRLAEAAPDDHALHTELCLRHLKVGALRRETGDLGAAQAAFETALAIAERLIARAPADPNIQKGLAICREEVADIRRRRG